MFDGFVFLKLLQVRIHTSFVCTVSLLKHFEACILPKQCTNQITSGENTRLARFVVSVYFIFVSGDRCIFEVNVLFLLSF